MGFDSESLSTFRTIVRERNAMLAVLLIAAVSYGGWRAARALADSLRGLPRRNEDMIFY
jgi:hypothetical protein